MPERRFPPPWSVEELEACFVVTHGAGQKLAYVYFEDEPGRRAAAKLLTKDDAADRGEYREAARAVGQGALTTGLKVNHIEICLWKLGSCSCKKVVTLALASIVRAGLRPSLNQFDGPNQCHGNGWGDEGKAAGCLLMAGGFAVFMGHSPMSLSLIELFS